MSRRWQDWINLIVGAWLFISPWALGFSSEGTPRGVALGVGAALALVAVWALAMPSAHLAEWSAVALGVGAFLAPRTLSFTDTTSAAWNAWIVGVIAAILAAWSLLQMAGRVSRIAGHRRRPAH